MAVAVITPSLADRRIARLLLCSATPAPASHGFAPCLLLLLRLPCWSSGDDYRLKVFQLSTEWTRIGLGFDC